MTDIKAYNVSEGARIIPIFHRIGQDLNQVLQIKGIEDKVKKLVATNAEEADSTLFEILTALLWKKNDWDVTFLPESTTKTPDIKATNGFKTFFVECKKFTKYSKYTMDERQKWVELSAPLSGLLMREKLSYVFDITFHTELKHLARDFIKDELCEKLKFSVPPCQLISNEFWSVHVSPVNIKAIQVHLRNNYVKLPSNQLNQLIGGKIDSDKNFMCDFKGKIENFGDNRPHTQYLDELDFAYGIFWKCDNSNAVQAKSRDIETKVKEAVKQFPTSSPSIVHVGIEAYDGREVEQERYYKILNTVANANFIMKDKDLQWLYCHLFQTYSPPDMSWVADETVYDFGKFLPAPLKFHTMLVPPTKEEGMHWLKDSPYI